jgi:hypothetical protein
MKLLSLLLMTGAVDVVAQCPNPDKIDFSIPPLHELIANLTGQHYWFSLDCLQGRIWDNWSGRPNFQFLVRAPAYNAEADITEFATDATRLQRGIMTATTFSYQLAPGPVVTQFQLVIRNRNLVWAANVQLTLTLRASQFVDVGSDLDRFELKRIDSDSHKKIFDAQKESTLVALAPSPSNASTLACVPQCTPSGSIPLSECAWYRTQLWLPDTYSAAASCACTLEGTAGALSPTAQCVRNYLLESHKGTTYFSQSLKNELATLRSQDCWNTRFGEMCLLGTFWNRLDAVIPTVYKVHQDAYKTCCCPGQPAPLWAWKAIFVTRMNNLLHISGCRFLIQQIQWQGPCGCDNL